MTAYNQKVLIIDDDPRNIFALSAVLKSKGVACLSAGLAKQGFDIIERTPDVGLVLLDMMMPEMDGYEMLRKLRESSHTRGLPVIAVTAQAMVGDKEKCIEAGANAYLPKPVCVNDLMGLLDTFLKPGNCKTT